MARNDQVPLLSLKKIVKTYQMGDQSLTVLDRVNLDIYEGEFVAILGPSGSGKSTLMHIASFLDQPSDGQIFLRGREVHNFSESDLAAIRNETIGFIFQQFNLLNRADAVDNVSLPLIYAGTDEKSRKEKAIKLLQLVGLGERLKNRPNQLSGGQQQRVAIARALVNDPKIIFADEPTGNLDSKSGEDIMHLLEKLNREENRTIVLVTHEQEVADYAHRQIFIKDGEISSDTVSLKYKKR